MARIPREIELLIVGINREEVSRKLKALRAKYHGKKNLKRVTFQLARSGAIKDTKSFSKNDSYHTSWIRVRTDGRRATLTLKEQRGTGMSKRKEYETEVGDFASAVRILRMALPGSEYIYAENSRETYTLDNAEITINKWPYLPYTLEIEGSSERLFNSVYKKLGIREKPSPNLAVSDREFYKLYGIDYGKIERMNKQKLDRLLGT